MKSEMTKGGIIIKTCYAGHRYTKSSDCSTCPKCEELRKNKNSFHSFLVAPARRALENKQITSLQQLVNYSEAEILQFHGLGPSSIPKLRNELKK